MTPLNVSSLRDHETSTPPATIQLVRGMTRAASVATISRNKKMPSAADSKRAPQLISWEPRLPIARPKSPTMAAAISGRDTTATAKRSAFHHIYVLDPARAAVAEIDDQDRQPDRCLRRGDGQHEHGENLPDEIAEEDRESHKV